MKINKKKFIYLISPNKIPNSFYKNLKLVLKTGKVSFFQLRLKSYSQNKKMIIGEKIKNIKSTQNTFNHRAKMCTLAAQGKWSSELENK